MIPFSKGESIIIACDNSGAIGDKEMDAVHVPYEMVSYFCFRTAVMECMAAGASPFALTVQNFCGNAAWKDLMNGISQGKKELGMEGISVTGSTESNFSLMQSAIGIMVLGKRSNSVIGEVPITDRVQLAVIGAPLVGNEVMERKQEIAPLSLFKEFCSMPDIVLQPVGSKGILYELNQIFADRGFEEHMVQTTIDLKKSSGPSTCFIIAFPKEKAGEVQTMAGQYFHEINIELK